MRIFTSVAILVLSFVVSADTGFGQDASGMIQRSDALYQQYRKTQSLEPLRQAISILESLPADFETSWRQARDYYSLGDDTKPHTEKLQIFEKAVSAGERAVQTAPGRAEGHYWLGVAYGGYGETKGKFKAFSLVGSIRKEMQTVISINPSYENAGAYLVLGKMDFELPRIVGGSTKRAIQEYEQGLKLAPGNPLMKTYLAEAYIDSGRKDEARAILLQIINMDKSNPAPELRDAQHEAQKLYDKNFK